ncbi:ABC transporter permease [Pyrobaculum sp.]|uniref:ABC transporter permease n=2 Tax=Pyrobaculum sp. TaxID=2004705 RepID=UPI00316372F2
MVLDRLADFLIWLIVKAISLFRKDWYVKNRSRVEEWRLTLYALNRSPTGIIGLVLSLGFVIVGVVGPFLAPYSYNQFLYLERPELYLAPPGAYGMPLGTDIYGRDVLSLMLYGARVSLVISIITIALGVPLGILLGLVAGYYGGKVDEAVMRITDIFLAFPALVLALALAATLPGRIREFLISEPTFASFMAAVFGVSQEDSIHLAPLISIFLALIIVWWPTYARVVRGMVLVEREKTYVEAAKALGYSSWRIMTRHILPNVMSPIVVLVTFDFATVNLLAAGLSFLGLGAQPPIVDWGSLINMGGSRFPTAWWLVFFPGVAIFLTALGWNLLGDALRDVFDPKFRRRIEFRV